MTTKIPFPLIVLAASLIALPSLALESEPPAARPTKAAGQAPAQQKLAPGVMGNIQLSQVRLEDVARLLSQIGNANVVVTSKVSDRTVSLFLRNASVDDMVRNLSRAAGVWYRFDATSKTYVIMSGEEYQKDLAIVRDEQTQIFTLRHHNVVSTANAIKALFGARVVLANPIEEMPPTALGSGNRSSTSGRSSSGSSTSGTSNSGNRSGVSSNSASGNFGTGGSNIVNNSGMFDPSQTMSTQGRAGMGAQGAAANYDPTADLGRMSQDRMAAQTRFDANGQPVLSGSDIQEMSARQGPAILVTYNKLNNLLMVRTGDEQALKEIGKLVSNMDRPPRQVLLEMKILEVTLDDGYRSVFDIGTGSQGRTTGPSGWGGTMTRETGILARNSMASGLFGVESNANLIWQVMSSSLSMRLQLLANENKLKVLSSPMLVAANNQIARLFIGDETVLTVGWTAPQTVVNSNTTTIQQPTPETEMRDVGQTLAILPRINGDKSVSLTVDQDSSTVKPGGATIPYVDSSGQLISFPVDTVATANLQVTAHAKHGMTVAIGGMIKETVIREDEKVPVIGDVPLLGFFFKRDVRSKVRTQIVLLITPTIIDSPEEGDSIATAKTQDFNAATATFPTTPTVPTLNSVWPVAPPTGIDRSNALDSDAAYGALARSAAVAMLQHDREPNRPPPEGLTTVDPGTRQFLVLENGMPAEVKGGWMRDGLYVTALRVRNWKSRNARLQAAALPGRWASIVIENPELGPDGTAEAATWLYAVSRQPFEQTLELP